MTPDRTERPDAPGDEGEPTPETGRRRRWILAGAAAVVAWSSSAVACGCAPRWRRVRPTSATRPPRSLSWKAIHRCASVTCSTVAGDLDTTVQYRLLDYSEPVTQGSELRADLVLPFTQVRPPVAVDFVSGEIRLRAPDGLRFTGSSTVPASNIDFTTARATVDDDGRGLIIVLTGSFPMNGTPRNVPVLSITGVVEAPSGTTLSFPPPDEVIARVDAGPFGSQRSTCSGRGDPSPMAEIPVTG